MSRNILNIGNNKMTTLNLGFIGLGIMGAPMANHLRAAGHTLYLNTRSKLPDALRDAGAIACADAAAVAQKADIIFTMLPDTPDVEKVLFSDNGVAKALSKGKVVVDMSSISPFATRQFAERIGALGCDYLDAPVGRVGAPFSPVPFSPVLEQLYVPDAARIAAGIREAVSRPLVGS